MFFASTAEKTLFMEVTDEQRQLAQQARKYGEQMQALSESAGGKKVCEIYRVDAGSVRLCRNLTVFKLLKSI